MPTVTLGQYPHPELSRRFDHIDKEVHDGRWLSEGWSPVKFSWFPDLSGAGDNDPIFLHLLHDGYQAIWLPKSSDFTVEVMCPPGTIEYFFTVYGKHVTAQDQPHAAPAAYPQKVNSTTRTTSNSPQGDIYGTAFEVHMSKVNVYHNSAGEGLLTSDREVECHLKPRDRPAKYVAPEEVKERIPWTIPVSLFRTYKPETKVSL